MRISQKVLLRAVARKYSRIVDRIHRVSRTTKKVLMVATDLLLIPFALWLSISLRLGEFFTGFQNNILLFAAVPFFTVPIFVRLGLYRAVMRYVGHAAIQQIFTGVLISSGIVLALTLYSWPSGVPRSTFAIYGFVALSLVGATRLFARLVFGKRVDLRGRSVAIYGAGASGRQLASMLGDGHEYRPIVYLDDDKDLIGREVKGVPVLDPAATNLVERLEYLGVTALFLAMPSVQKSVKRRILKCLEGLPFYVFTVPGLEEIVSGAATVSQIREVSIEDILGRDPVPPNESLLGRCITDKSVLVTGAGGSIGSELCRQVLTQRPKRLILLDHSEFALFSIEQELQRINTNFSKQIPIVAVLGSVCDQTRVERTIDAHGVDTIYHAAAYKHVPLVEFNPVAGVQNNVFGTKVVAEVAWRLCVKHFVLVSTDKAVRPTNVMGASKRLGELIVQDMASRSTKTTYSMVRFGNVLGSSGSVVPLFRQQIKRGGPITVTHPEITRYFMTIPEAVQLVIQAGAMAKGGDVFVLDMGEPIKIYELARQVIRFSGLEMKDQENPEGDIEIIFTGLRPGEKLYEELLIGGVVSGTDHASILRAEESKLPAKKINKILLELESAILRYDVQKIKTLLVIAVTGYLPKEEDCVSNDEWVAAQSNNVRSLSEKLGTTN